MDFIIRDIAKNNTTSTSVLSSGGSGGSSYTPLNYLPLIVQSSNLAGSNGIIKLTNTNYLLSDAGWKFSMVNTGGTLTDLMTLDANGNLSVKGEVCSYSVGTGSTSGSGLIQTVFGYSSLGNSFDNSDLTSTFNAYTINQLNNRIVTIENTNYLTGLNSTLINTALGYIPYNSSNPNSYISSINNSMVISALGFTPYNSSNPNNYITSSSLSGYALTSSIPTNTNQLTNGSGYITSSSLTNYLPLSGGSLSGNLTTKGLSITNGSKTVNLVVDANGYLSIDNNLYSSGDICAFGAGSGSTSGNGLIQTVYSYSNLGGTFSNSTLTDTFNAYTINQMNSRLISVENGSLTSISSALVTNTLGYTPYNATTNTAGYITASSLTPYQLSSTAINTSNIASQSVNNSVLFNGHSFTDVFSSVSHFSDNINTNYNPTGSDYYIPSTTGIPSNYGVTLNIKNNGQNWNNQLAFSTGGDIFFRQAINTSDYTGIPFVKLYHSGNFNPANYSTIANVSVPNTNIAVGNSSSNGLTYVSGFYYNSGINIPSNNGYYINTKRFVYYDGTTYIGDIDNASGGSTIIRCAGNDAIKLTNGNAATFAGNIYVNAVGGNYNEGIRINQCSNGYAVLTLGGATNSTSGTDANTWGLFAQGGNFRIVRNGSGTGVGLDLMSDGTAKWLGNNLITSGNIGSQSVNDAKTLSLISNNVAVNLNTIGLGKVSNYASTSYWTNAPAGFSYGTVYNLGGQDSVSLSLQLASDVNHNSTNSTNTLWFRTGNNLGFQNDWKQIIHSGNIGSQSVNYANNAGCSTNSQFVDYLPNRTDSANYPILWGSGQGTNGNTGNNRTYSFSCAAVTINSYLGQVNAQQFKTNTFCGLIGDYAENGTTDKIIWTIGSSWATLGGHYGLGYTYEPISGYGHSLFLANAGTKNIWLSCSTGNAKFNGNIIAGGEVTAYTTSDKRLKKNIKSLTNSLDIINKINPVSYNWNNKAKELNSAKTDEKQYGVIAQELKEILPELTHNMYSDEKYIGVDYMQLIPHLIGAIKELTTEINKLKNNK